MDRKWLLENFPPQKQLLHLGAEFHSISKYFTAFKKSRWATSYRAKNLERPSFCIFHTRLCLLMMWKNGCVTLHPRSFILAFSSSVFSSSDFSSFDTFIPSIFHPPFSSLHFHPRTFILALSFHFIVFLYHTWHPSYDESLEKIVREWGVCQLCRHMDIRHHIYVQVLGS